MYRAIHKAVLAKMRAAGLERVRVKLNPNGGYSAAFAGKDTVNGKRFAVAVHISKADIELAGLINETSDLVNFRVANALMVYRDAIANPPATVAMETGNSPPC